MRRDHEKKKKNLTDPSFIHAQKPINVEIMNADDEFMIICLL